MVSNEGNQQTKIIPIKILSLKHLIFERSHGIFKLLFPLPSPPFVVGSWLQQHFKRFQMDSRVDRESSHIWFVANDNKAISL